jgi:hypothetical protein
MAMNGKVGRATQMAKIRRMRAAEARSDGVDPADRKAMNEWNNKRIWRLYDPTSPEYMGRKDANEPVR